MGLSPWGDGQQVSFRGERYSNVSDLEAFLTEALLAQNSSMFALSNKSDFFTNALNLMDVYLMPVIILVGLFGNTLSFLVFSCSHLRRLSSSLYLCMLALSDIGYLLALSVVWLERIDIRLFHTPGWCQGVLYVNYICGLLSIWSVVSFTTERYIIVYHPLRKDTLCSRRRAKIVLIALVVCACLLYSYVFCTQIVFEGGTQSVCIPDPSYDDVTAAMMGIDTLFACLIPSCIIILLNLRLIKKIHDYQTRRADDKKAVLLSVDQRKRHPRHHTSISTSGSMRIKFSLPPTDNSLVVENTAPNFAICQRDGRNPRHFRTARMLLVLSSVSVLLHLPRHVVRLHVSINDLFLKTTRLPKLEMELYQLFQIWYFLSFAINFFVYSACGRPFRSGLMRLCRRWRYKIIKMGKCFTQKRSSDTSLNNLQAQVLSINGHNVKINWHP